MPLSVVRVALDRIDICAMTAAETLKEIEKPNGMMQILYCKKVEETLSLDIPKEYSDQCSQ